MDDASMKNFFLIVVLSFVAATARAGSSDYLLLWQVEDPVVELIGGTDDARTYVERALRSGKHVVTANKQMLSLHYEEITGLAKSRGLELGFSATAGGGIPWLVNLARMASVDEVESVYGVMNGTTNFILDAMQSKDQSYEEALKEAQTLGYAEADPTADVMGYDVRAKLAISCNIAFISCFSNHIMM